MSDDLSGDMLAPSWPNLVYDAAIILQFEEPLFSLITSIKSHCIFVLKKLYFGVFKGESLSPPPVHLTCYFSFILLATNILEVCIQYSNL